MADIKPFKCIRPNREAAPLVAALPYDVYNSREAKEEVLRQPLSFLKIDRAETQFEGEMDPCAPCVYEKARELLEEMLADKTMLTDAEECYYVYELCMDGRTQTGITACASVDDYLNGVIKKHENTRADKELDRINHVDRLDAQTGPIFLAYRSQKAINEIVERAKREEPLYYFTAPDGIGHHVWKIRGEAETEAIRVAFAAIGEIYIADGHHRAASAVRVGLKRRQEHPGYTGGEEFNYFLSVLFPHDQLFIMDYNRVVKDLNGYSAQEFLEQVSESFEIIQKGTGAFRPGRKGEIGMYLEGCWYALRVKEALRSKTDVVAALDVSFLQDYLLGPVLGIQDPRTDKRIDFIGGIRGLGELERRVNEDMKAAFAMYPTSIEELFSVADAGRLMPPKSTWFEPKLRSGLFIHRIGIE